MAEAAAKQTGRLSAGAIHLQAILEGYCAASLRTKGQAVAFVSQKTLARKLGRSIGQVKRYVAELVSAEIVITARGHRAMNRYEMRRSNGAPALPSNGACALPSKVAPALPSNGAPARRSDDCPIREDLVLTQQEQTAAAEKAILKNPEALQALTDAGLSASAARPYAEADRGGLCKLAAAYYAECAAKKLALNQVVTLGLLVEFLRAPADYFSQGQDGTWQPPRDSMIFRNLKQAEVELIAAEARETRLKAEAETRERDRLLKLQPDADAAAWGQLGEDERRGIENGVARERPLLARDGEMFRRHCYVWMRRYLAAMAQESAWQALGDDEKAKVEAEARARFPLWAATAEGLRSACLTVMQAPGRPFTDARGGRRS